ncbi:uncharacterized protein YALI1_A01260g [Yarrowia lipolytica]|uniref:Uncharacterized protein n=1 Tax=Yarrowia lipolytica TaxID=4952 RepID=A0A1D8N3A6_YARLL|nr:hypothetical protein YALI1_A01260g [Yarrowia lipolytica]
MNPSRIYNHLPPPTLNSFSKVHLLTLADTCRHLPPLNFFFNFFFYFFFFDFSSIFLRSFCARHQLTFKLIIWQWLKTRKGATPITLGVIRLPTVARGAIFSRS